MSLAGVSICPLAFTLSLLSLSPVVIVSDNCSCFHVAKPCQAKNMSPPVDFKAGSMFPLPGCTVTFCAIIPNGTNNKLKRASVIFFLIIEKIF